MDEMNIIRKNVKIIKQFADIPEFTTLKVHMMKQIRKMRILKNM